MADRSYFNDAEGSNHKSIRRGRSRQVDFYVFKTEYWCRFPREITKNVSLELIFAEIMGIIKGSISSADTLVALTRGQYFQTSSRIAPTFTTEAERERVYNIYELYEKLKRETGDIDQIDRVLALLRDIRKNPGLSNHLEQAFDLVYIDGLHQNLG